MSKKVINKAVTREACLYGQDKDRIGEYYGNVFDRQLKTPDIHLNIYGYTDLYR